MKTNLIIFFVIFIYLIQIQLTIAASLTKAQSGIDDILQTESLLDCSNYKNDQKIIHSFPFRVEINPFLKRPTMTYASMNNSKIYYIHIVNQEFVPSTIFCLKHLSGLYIRNTSFYDFKDQLPHEIEYFASSLTELSISDTKIAYLPKQIGKLTHLQTLQLSNTSLTSLPDTIGSLSLLTMLYLPNNKLTSLPTTIKNLQLLQQITLSNNTYLRSIKSLNYLSSLRTLDTRHCSIEELPNNLPQLNQLYMSNNNLKELNGIETLGYKTSNKKSFYFDMNHIQSIPPEIQLVRNLDWLNLNHNQLDNLPTDIFKVTTLSHLNIQYNRFRDHELKAIENKFSNTNPNLKLYYGNKRKSIRKYL